MRRARVRAIRHALAWLAISSLPLAGCSREKPASGTLSFESLPDTVALSQGSDILQEFEPSRMKNGAVRVHGRMRLPDSTKVQVTIRKPGTTNALAMAHVQVIQGTFDSPPLLGETGPLPRANYQFEVRVHFNEDWQPLSVLRQTQEGRALHGPGMTRARNGDAALYLTREGPL